MLPSGISTLTRDQPYSEKNVCGSGWGVGCDGTCPLGSLIPLAFDILGEADALGSSRAFLLLGSCYGWGTLLLPHPTQSLCTLTTPELSRNPGGQRQGCWEKLMCRLPSEAGAACCSHLGQELHRGLQQSQGRRQQWVFQPLGPGDTVSVLMGRGQEVGFIGWESAGLQSDWTTAILRVILLSPNSP